MQEARDAGLFNLLDDNLFCKALCCGPCIVGQNEGKFLPKETSFGGREQAAAYCWLALSPLGFLTNWMCASCWHYNSRRAFVDYVEASEETECTSCFYVTCCSVCSLAQMNRTLRARLPPPKANFRKTTLVAPTQEVATAGAVWRPADIHRKQKPMGTYTSINL
jgi:hypothetical protein